MTESEIIWTSKMSQLRDEISDCNGTGVFVSDLTNEDSEDFAAYLQKEKIPVLMLYKIDYPMTSGNPYDGYETEEIELNCIVNFTLDAPAKNFLEKIDKCTEVGLFGGYDGQLEEDRTEIEKNTRVVYRYTKRVAKALRDFSEVGVVLDQDDLASEMMGEFSPEYSNSRNEGVIPDRDKIKLSKSKMRFSNNVGEYSPRRGSAGYAIFSSTLIDGREFISYSDILEVSKNDGHYRIISDKVNDIKNYLEKELKNNLGLEGDAIVLDKENKCVRLSRWFRDMVVVVE